MNKKNFYVGMGMGIAACGCAALIMKPKKKRCMKSAMGKALRNMSEVADSISDAMGW